MSEPVVDDVRQRNIADSTLAREAREKAHLAGEPARLGGQISLEASAEEAPPIEPPQDDPIRFTGRVAALRQTHPFARVTLKRGPQQQQPPTGWAMNITSLDSADFECLSIHRCHLHYLQQQARFEFFYWKVMFAFFLYVLAMFILKDKGIVTSGSFPITIFGIGCLLVYYLTHRLDIQNERHLLQCIDLGASLEERRDLHCLDLPKAFSAYRSGQSRCFRAHLLSRLFPIFLVGVTTSVSVASLAGATGSWSFIAILTACMSVFASYLIALTISALKAYVSR